MEQAVQILGAILVLIGYVLGQTGRVDTSSRSYLVINLVGSALLAAVAAQGRQWGFLVLNGTWAVISTVSLARQAMQASNSDFGAES